MVTACHTDGNWPKMADIQYIECCEIPMKSNLV